jgi:hypothetical protein
MTLTDIETPLREQLVCALFQHRIATADQLRQMLTPEATSSVYLRRLLGELKTSGLVGSTRLGANRWVWFLTEAGLDQAAGLGQTTGRRPRHAITERSAAGLWYAHALTVVQVGLAFLDAARRRGDEFGVLDWTPEVAHRVRDGADRAPEDLLIADALLHYTLNEPTGERIQLRAFVELDRNRMSSERVAAKLISYARFWEYVPAAGRGRAGHPADLAWQRTYPRFPRILFLLTGGGTAALERRIADLHAMATGHPQVARMATQVPLGATTLHQLEVAGPFGPIWTQLHNGQSRRSLLDL